MATRMPTPQPGSQHTGLPFRRWALAISILLAVVGAGTVIAYYQYPFQPLGPVQPIPFSHRVHAGEKQIGCLFCHPQARGSSVAGIPPLETCLLCHEHIIREYPQIRTVRAHFETGEPIRWIQVFDLPDHAYFPHSVHLAAQVDCSRCHGDVRAMDRLLVVEDHTMGFCTDCHRDENATHDCFTCHR